MLDFEFYSPTKFYFGKDKENEVGSIAKAYGFKKILLHHSGGSSEKSGLLDRVRRSLDAENISYVELSGVVPNPRLDLVREGINLCREEYVDLILAVGGGSVVDSAKAIALGIPYEGDVWDFYAGKAKAQVATPIGTIITIAATGSEASNSTVITNTDNPDKWIKTGHNSDLVRPLFSIMNPELTFSLPDYHLAAGAVDIFSHCFERYVTRTENVDLTDRLIESVMKSVFISIKQALANRSNYEAHANLMWAGTLAHNNVLGVGRQQDWSSHQIEHQLSAYNDMTHGAGLALVIPAFMLYTLDGGVERYYLFATRVMGVTDDPYDKRSVALEGIERLKNLFSSIGMPVSLEEANIDKNDLTTIVDGIRMNNGDKLGYFQALSKENIVELLKLA